MGGAAAGVKRLRKIDADSCAGSTPARGDGCIGQWLRRLWTSRSIAHAESGALRSVPAARAHAPFAGGATQTTCLRAPRNCAWELQGAGSWLAGRPTQQLCPHRLSRGSCTSRTGTHVPAPGPPGPVRPVRSRYRWCRYVPPSWRARAALPSWRRRSRRCGGSPRALHRRLDHSPIAPSISTCPSWPRCRDIHCDICLDFGAAACGTAGAQCRRHVVTFAWLVGIWERGEMSCHVATFAKTF